MGEIIPYLPADAPGYFSFPNPLYKARVIKDETVGKDVNGGLNIDFKIAEGLYFKSQVYSRLFVEDENTFVPTTLGKQGIGSAASLSPAAPPFNELKLRASYGKTGNSAIGDYERFGTIVSIPNLNNRDNNYNYTLGNTDRANLPPLKPEEVTDQESFSDALAHERRVELAFENHRWFDLVRTGKAIEVMRAYGAIEMADPTTPPGFLQFNEESFNVQPYMLLYPIPANELNKTKNIKQNPGY